VIQGKTAPSYSEQTAANSLNENSQQDISIGLFLKKHFPTAERRMAKEQRLPRTVTLSRRALGSALRKVNHNAIHKTDLTL